MEMGYATLDDIKRSSTKCLVEHGIEHFIKIANIDFDNKQWKKLEITANIHGFGNGAGKISILMSNDYVSLILIPQRSDMNILSSGIRNILREILEDTNDIKLVRISMVDENLIIRADIPKFKKEDSDTNMRLLFNELIAMLEKLNNIDKKYFYLL
jgi:hypothetical protein